jgi:hypothetical protein
MVAGAGMKLIDGVDLLLKFFTSQLVHSSMVTGSEMKLMMLICSWHSLLDRM